MTGRNVVRPFSHASHRLDRAFDPACSVRRSRPKRRQPAGDSDHLGEPRAVRLAVAGCYAGARDNTISETKSISHVHPSSAGGDVSQGHHHRRSGWFAPWIRPPGD
jgi:hypothetical protein